MSDNVSVFKANVIHSLRIMQDKMRDMEDEELFKFIGGTPIETCVCVNNWELEQSALPSHEPPKLLRLALRVRNF